MLKMMLIPIMALLWLSSCRTPTSVSVQESLVLGVATTNLIENWYGSRGNQVGHGIYLQVNLATQEAASYFDRSGMGLPNPKTNDFFTGRWQITQGSNNHLKLFANATVPGFYQINGDGNAEATSITSASILRFYASRVMPAGSYTIQFEVLDKPSGLVIKQFQRSIELMPLPNLASVTLKRGTQVSQLDPATVLDLSQYTVSDQTVQVPARNSTKGRVMQIVQVVLKEGTIASAEWVLGSEVLLQNGAGTALSATTTPSKNLALKSLDLSGALLVMNSNGPATAPAIDAATATATARATLKVYDQYGQIIKLVIDFIN